MPREHTTTSGIVITSGTTVTVVFASEALAASRHQYRSFPRIMLMIDWLLLGLQVHFLPSYSDFATWLQHRPCRIILH